MFCAISHRWKPQLLPGALKYGRGYKSHTGCFGLLPLVQSRRKDLPKDKKYNNNFSLQDYQLLELVNSYRTKGHLCAATNPLKAQGKYNINICNEDFGLSDMSREYNLKGILNMDLKDKAPLGDIVTFLRNVYCGKMSIEIDHVLDDQERAWLYKVYEGIHTWSIKNDEKVELAKTMLKSQIFDNFLARKFATVKRYGGEGAETSMCFFNEAFRLAALNGYDDVVLCIPHRGRLNLLVGSLNYPPAQMFSKIKGNPEFSSTYKFSGDVLSHLVSSTDLTYEGHRVHLTMLPNPSHLEAVNPVAVGKARGKLLVKKLAPYNFSDDNPDDKVLCFQVHGDAAFAAQGIVMETLCLAHLPHFEINGSVHLIVNNQIGFTTPAERATSALNASDIGKMIGCPVIRVNGEDPEEVMKACHFAMEYRMKYKKEVIVDLLCYRRWGHNELDDPSFTQPSMYRMIENKKSIPDLYAERLVATGVTTPEDFNSFKESEMAYLNAELAASANYVPEPLHFRGNWEGVVQADSTSVSLWDTGYPIDGLLHVGGRSVQIPDDFNIHPHLKKTFCEARLAKLKNGQDIEWATAEALAIGSLLMEGYNVRLSGQDVGRGTFSHRHMMLVDQNDDEILIPLNELSPTQSAFLEIANSPLSEEAVLGFEYGMSIESPKNLCIWEAQFGDFFNGAQVVIDTFLFQGEAKWLIQSGLVLLLPHGQDGAGPEHSSCRLERFLQLSDSKEDAVDGDDVNVEIVNPTTPAQYFHLLRRQMKRNYRKPLVVASPKMILRLPAAVSSLEEMGPQTYFQPVLTDNSVDCNQVKKVIFCSGKHFYALDKMREKKNVKDVALVRIEALCPFPAEQIKEELKKYSNAEDFVWSQEEHRNMGPWSFVRSRFQNLCSVKLRYVGRPIQPTPATGVVNWHHEETEMVMENSFS